MNREEEDSSPLLKIMATKVVGQQRLQLVPNAVCRGSVIASADWRFGRLRTAAGCSRAPCRGVERRRLHSPAQFGGPLLGMEGAAAGVEGV